MVRIPNSGQIIFHNNHHKAVKLNICQHFMFHFTYLEAPGHLSPLVLQTIQEAHYPPWILGDLLDQEDLANHASLQILVSLEFRTNPGCPSLQEDLQAQTTLDCPADLAILSSQVHLCTEGKL